MKTTGKLSQIIRAATLVEPREQRVVLLSFLLIFILMAAYYMLRPVRDAMASDWSNTEISVLWNIQFFLSAGIIALYGLAVSRFRFRLLVPSIYGFFAISFICFRFGSSYVADPVLLDKGFYLWVSLFSLFHVSVFWSFMADMFSREQSKRLFAIIAVGASAGAIMGPLIATVTAQTIGAQALMLVASIMLLLIIPMIFYLQNLRVIDLHRTGESDNESPVENSMAIGGNALAGFKLFASSPYLLGIAAFILLYTAIGSFAYFEQTNLLRAYDIDRRTEILALLVLVINVLTFVLGFFATSRMATKIGMPFTLAIVPIFMCLALAILAFAPILTVLLALQVARSAGNYGVTKPAREMLFTAVSRESRFKAKPVVDVVVYRGGDAVWSIAFAFLTDGIGLGLAAMAAIGAGIAATWAAVGFYLGRVFNGKERDQQSLRQSPDAVETSAATGAAVAEAMVKS